MALSTFKHVDKDTGDLIRAEDWNEFGEELERLENDKVNRSGDTIQGELKVTTRAEVGYLQVKPQNNASEGGEIRLDGAGNNQSIHIDNLAGDLRVHSQGTTKLCVKENGNVGVGHANPTCKLDINANNNHLIMRRPDQSTAGKQLFLELYQERGEQLTYPSIRFHHGGKYWRRIEGRDNGIHFKEGDLNNDNHVPIYASRLGLGTDSPQAALDVRGSIMTGGPGGERVEINQQNSGNRYAYLDFHGDDTYTDYSLRIIRDRYGKDTGSYIQHRGKGVLSLHAVDGGTLTLRTGSVNSLAIASNADATFARKLTVNGDLFGAAKNQSNASVKIRTGRTPWGSTKWVQYGSAGLYTDIDISHCGFSSAPNVISSIHGAGSHWGTTGGSAVYSLTNKSFRIYVRHSSGGSLNTTYARDQKWCIAWVAIGV